MGADRPYSPVRRISPLTRRILFFNAFALFILIGAQPHTAWLPAEIARDRYGFVVTGPENDAWPLDRLRAFLRKDR